MMQMAIDHARRVASAMLVALVAALLISAAPASATTSQGADTVELPMTIVGFDPKVAAANGYPTTAPSAARGSLSTLDDTGIVTGNCGSSFVTLKDVGVRKYTVITGFGVPYAAVSYSWSVNVVGPNWNKTHPWGGGLAFRTTWEGTVTNVVGTGGWCSAKASGTAVLSNGWICKSGGPIANETIY
jgi:hypothetical protein